MWLVALKMIIGDRLKYLGLLVGVAFSALLITQQSSILVGLAYQTGSFIRDTSQADLWVMDSEVRFSQDSLPLADTMVYRVRGVDGVAWAVPLYQGFLLARLPDGTRQRVILVGLDDATLTGAPPAMVTGRLEDLRQDGAVMIDEGARQSKMRLRRDGDRMLQVGERFSINDNDARIIGTFSASKSFFWEPVVYTTYTRALRFAPKERRLMAYVLVRVKPGEDVQAVAERIRLSTGQQVLTNDEFIQLTTNYILNETGILINFGLAVALGFAIGVLVCGQMLYNFTLDNLRYFGALKAMGTGNLVLVGMVLVQVLVVGILGYGIGIGLGSVMGKVVGDAGLAFRMPWQIPVLALGAIGVICVMAGLLSVWRVLRLEPAVVFKS